MTSSFLCSEAPTYIAKPYRRFVNIALREVTLRCECEGSTMTLLLQTVLLLCALTCSAVDAEGEEITSSFVCIGSLAVSAVLNTLSY